jgi:hypothetical protein
MNGESCRGRTVSHGVIGRLHDLGEPDREGRSATGLALDRLIARPRPVPPYLLAVVEEAWENSWNSLAICSAVMPMLLQAINSIL